MSAPVPKPAGRPVKRIFVTGGAAPPLGKGPAAASIGGAAGRPGAPA